MAVEYGFFDTLPDGVTAAEYREDQASVVFGAAVPDGLALTGDDNGAATVAGDGSGVLIAAGTIGFAKGFYFKVTGEDFAVAVDAADASARIDRIVARLDKSANTFVPFYLKGTAGSVTPPALTRTDDVYDLRMWQVTRATNGGLSLTDDRDWGAADIHVTTSTNQPPSNAGFAFEWQTDTNKLIRRDGDGNRRTLIEDSGEIALSARGDWQISSGLTVAGRRLNGWVRIRIALTRTTAALRTSDTDGSPLLTPLPTSLRPNVVEYGRASLSGRSEAELVINTSGEATLFGLTEDLPVGGTLRCSMVYPGA